jgi:iron complex transport system ATP-binding protein
MAEALRVRDLSVHLAGKLTLHGVNFGVEAGNLLGILGPNGAGKTTLLKAIIGLIPQQGSVLQAGNPLSELGIKERARRVAYVPQRSLLNAPLSVSSVVAQGRYCHGSDLAALTPTDRRAIEAALEVTDMRDLAERRFTELSGGEQRRVLLARALATEAPVILLDEPSASLDLGHSLRLFHHMKQLTESGRALVVVLHDLNDASRWCDSALLHSEGRVAALGSPAEVVTSERVRHVYGVELEHKSTLAFSLPRVHHDTAR